MSAWFALCTDHDNALRCCRECRRNPSRREHDRNRLDKGQQWRLPYRSDNHCKDQMYVNKQEEDAA